MALCNNNTKRRRRRRRRRNLMRRDKRMSWPRLMTRAFLAGSRSHHKRQAPCQRTITAGVVSRNHKRRSHSNRLIPSIATTTAAAFLFASRCRSEGSALSDAKLRRENQHGYTQYKQKSLHCCCCCWALVHWHLYRKWEFFLYLSLTSKRPFFSSCFRFVLLQLLYIQKWLASLLAKDGR